MPWQFSIHKYNISSVQIFNCILHHLRAECTKLQSDQLTVGLHDSSVGRALHRYRRGHGFESRSGLNFFHSLTSQLLNFFFLLWFEFFVRVRIKNKLRSQTLQNNACRKNFDFKNLTFLIYYKFMAYKQTNKQTYSL